MTITALLTAYAAPYVPKAMSLAASLPSHRAWQRGFMRALRLSIPRPPGSPEDQIKKHAGMMLMTSFEEEEEEEEEEGGDVQWEKGASPSSSSSPKLKLTPWLREILGEAWRRGGLLEGR